MRGGKRRSIGTELKVIMKKEGITGYRIFKETDIEQSYISKLLHDKVNPTYLTLKRILDVLGYRVRFEKVPKRSKSPQKRTRRKG